MSTARPGIVQSVGTDFSKTITSGLHRQAHRPLWPVTGIELAPRRQVCAAQRAAPGLGGQTEWERGPLGGLHGTPAGSACARLVPGTTLPWLCPTCQMPTCVAVRRWV